MIKFFKDVAVISAITVICFVLLLEGVHLFVKPLVMFENRINRRILPDSLEEILSFKNKMLIDKFRRNELRRDKLVNYGADPLFFVMEPGFVVKDRYESMGYFYRTVDETGYLNRDMRYYNQHKTIDIFFAGDSVLQGAGMPSAVESLKKRSKLSIWILALGSYGPRQKAQALIEFAVKRNPKLVIIDFSLSDASDSIGDFICEKYNFDFRGRFHFRNLKGLLLKSPSYKDFLKVEKTSWLYEHSISYNACHQIKNNIFSMFKKSAPVFVEKNISLSSIAMSKPAYSRFSLREECRLPWVKAGVALALKEYERLLSKIDRSKTKVVILYNPSSYEVYRDILPKHLIDETADRISSYQKERLMSFCKENDIIYFDLTDGLRQYAAKDYYIFGKNEGTHWSTTGVSYAVDILDEFLSKNDLW